MKSLIVIDNFYREPDRVRDFALNRVDYVKPDQLAENFPGTESVQSFYSAGTVDKIENAIGEKIVVDPKNYSFAVFCKTYLKDQRKNSVHVDQSDWTGLIYLTPPAICEGGTSFFQHRETGLDRIPDDQKLLQMGYKDRNDFIQRFLSPQGQDVDRWSTTARVKMKYNRMILFRAGEMFHSADGYFGHEDQNCRLTQLFFFKTGGVQ